MATLIGTSGNEVLTGTASGDAISDGAGNDYVIGGAGNDTVTGGAGNDWYEAGSGTNTLNLSSGFGNDIIDVFTNHGGPPYTDVLNFTNIFSENLFAYRVGDSYGLSVIGGTDTVAVPDFFSVSPAPFGSSSAPLQAGGTDTSTPTTDSDGNGIPDIQEIPYLRFGTAVNDTINVTNVGNHQNIIWGGLDSDTITGSTNFAMLFGGGGNDTLTTGSSATYSYLVGGSGDDTYSVPTGRLAFIADFGSSTNDTLSAPGISTASATLQVATIDNRHLWVYEPSNGTQFFIFDWTTSANKIESYQLGNGTFSFAQVQSVVANANVPNLSWETWSGSTVTTAEANAQLAQVQTLAGNDSGPTLGLVVGGTNGNDSTVYGFGGNDTLIGDVGSDNLVGYGGNDQYVFRPGDGVDFIDNNVGASLGETNYLRFGGGIRAGQLSAVQNGDTLQISYGANDQVSLFNWYFGGATGTIAQQVQIGTSDSPVMRLVGPGTAGTAASEMLIGSAAADSISAGGGGDWITPSGGNDTVDGGAGMETVVYAGPRSSYSIAYSGGAVTVTDLDGASNGGNDGADTLSSVEWLRFSDSTVSLVPRNDFNGDRLSDLFWSNPNGSLAQWQLNGTSFVGGGVLSGAPSGWSVAGQADFNGDGKIDILWQNANGALAEWFMNGTSVVGGGVMPGPVAGWTLAATADFNGDGMADLLWRHSSGALCEWQMNGTTVAGGGVMSGPGAGWTLATAADFTGDGMADILWQNANGALNQWQMNGTAVTGGGAIAGPGGGWTLKGAADFTGDGRADLLWQAGTTLAEWYMNGTGVAGGGVFAGAPGTWSIAGLADFTGDARADILWSDSGGGLAQWQMNGTAVTGGGALGAKPAGWNLVNTGQLIG